MKTSAWVLGACLLAGMVDARVARAGEELRLIEHALTDTQIHLGPKGDAMGDLLPFANPIFAADNRTQVGRDQGFCIRTVAGKSWECSWTVMLAQGQITVEGPYYDDRDSVVAITGGTGKYAGARGSMTLHARDKRGTAFDFTYKLL